MKPNCAKPKFTLAVSPEAGNGFFLTTRLRVNVTEMNGEATRGYSV